ncbi:MAG: chemotaxis protein CheW, partial [Firmicutes bacterium]|nr:chemotaxis protein CheW [Bacillota bacterium]
ITVEDDGRGIDPERLRRSAVSKGLLTEEAARRLGDDEAVDLIFLPGFSTAAQVTEVSGRGVGMDVVRRNIERLNGSVEVDTTLGRGSRFRIALPLTLAIIQALLVEGGEVVFAIPLGSVVEALHLRPGESRRINKKEVIQVRGEVVPLMRLKEVFWGQKGAGGDEVAEAGEDKSSPGTIPVVMVNISGKHLGIAVDDLLGEQEVVIKGLGRILGDIPGVAGATILGDGRVALIMDVAGFAKLANVQGKERVHRWTAWQREAAGTD